MAVNRHHLVGQIVFMVMLDMVCLLAGILLSIALRVGVGTFHEFFLDRIYGWFYFAGSIVLANFISGSYGIQIKVSRFNIVVNWLFSVLIAFLVISVTSYTWLQFFVGRGVLILAIGLYSVLWLTVNAILYQWIFSRQFFSYKVAILGSGSDARQLAGVVGNTIIRPLHHIVATIDFKKTAPYIDDADKEKNAPRQSSPIPQIIVTPENLVETVRKLQVDALLISQEHMKFLPTLYPHLRRLRYEGFNVLDPYQVSEIFLGRIPLELVDEQWLTLASTGITPLWNMRFSRVLSFVMALAALIVAVPLALIISACLKSSAPRLPVIFRQPRMGQFGKTFIIYKFRTMLPGKDSQHEVWAAANDPRVTRLGRFLRKYRLDELPQLINIIKGEMNLVGPRPEQPAIVAELEKKIPYYRERENVPPGLTGWAQIRYPYGSSIEDTCRKLEYDLYYIKNLSLALDVRIILHTVRTVILGLERHSP